MSRNDVDLFERKRSEAGMSKSAFIRLLIAEHDEKVPSSIQYKDIIKELSGINTSLNEILISGKFDIATKLILEEKIKDAIALFKERLK